MKSPILSITKLNVARGQTRLVHDVSLSVNEGETHMIMGPNGSGKSTFLNAIMGNPQCSVESGTIAFDGKNIIGLPPSARARLGIFMIFQNPIALAGVPFAHVVQAAREAIPERFAKNEQHLTPAILGEKMRVAGNRIGLDAQFVYRSLNDGFSGGEKKKAELVQLMLLQPKCALIDEIDSGLDVDALRTVCAVLEEFRLAGMALIIVTHNPRLIEYIKPNAVHVLIDGRIVTSGMADLAQKIETEGYDSIAVS